jgi:hypothetical protein
MQDGQLKVISYGSRLLNKAEKNYCVTDKELLAVRYFIENYRQYLLGRKLCVRTDHQALIWLFSMKEPKGRLARWLEILSPFMFSLSIDLAQSIQIPTACRDVAIIEIVNVMKQTMLNI